MNLHLQRNIILNCPIFVESGIIITPNYYWFFSDEEYVSMQFSMQLLCGVAHHITILNYNYMYLWKTLEHMEKVFFGKSRDAMVFVAYNKRLH